MAIKSVHITEVSTRRFVRISLAYCTTAASSSSSVAHARSAHGPHTIRFVPRLQLLVVVILWGVGNRGVRWGVML